MAGQHDTLSWLRHSARALAFGNPLYGLTLSGRAPTALACVPPDPWPGDAERGSALLGGTYAFAGDTVVSDMPDWTPGGVAPAWIAAFNGFDWVRDLRALGGDDARRHVRMLVTSWLDRNASWHADTWAPDVLGTRIANWIGLHDFYCQSADDLFRARVFESLARQARHLYRVTPGALKGAPLMSAVRGLAYAGVALPGGDKFLNAALKLLQDELPRQILPDGGHVQRNPEQHMEVLRHLIDLRNALRAGRQELPESLQHAIDRMTPALRFFRHGDGALALFNGGQEAMPNRLDAVLAHSDARGRPLKSMPHSGFERLLAGRTLVLMDTGRAPPRGLDRTAHAGALSFEMSVGRERVIVNCGAHPRGAGPWRRALAATAAHTTLSVAETNSAEVLEDGGIGRRMGRTACERIEHEGATLIEASHDGYARSFGLTHHRRLYLAEDGEDLRGEDVLEGPAGHAFSVRFHLHPSVQVSPIQNGSAALLRLPSGMGWRLRVAGGRIEVAESIYLGQGTEPRRSSQIVVTGETQPDRTVVKWALRREKKQP